MKGATTKVDPRGLLMIKTLLMAGQMRFWAKSIAQAAEPSGAFNCRISLG